MKRVIVNLCILFALFSLTASAESIHTDTAEEYLNVLFGITDTRQMSVADDTEKDIDDRMLLVRYDGELDARGAAYDICDKYSIHTLIYETKRAADAAYEYYAKIGISACRNEELSVAYVTPDTTYAPYLSWGARGIGSDIFKERLETKYASTDDMPKITVAVIDSGIDYTHPFLENRVDISRGYDCRNNDTDPFDDNHHGTHVAGIIADNTPENVTLVPIKITDKYGNTDTKFFKAGIEKALELKADIINISIATDTELDDEKVGILKTTFGELFDNAEQSGITICIAAGNGALNADKVFPGFMESAITVANSQPDGGINTKSSNYGSVIDIAAPGTKIYSTYPVNKGSYGELTGTSMSCPFATASAALLMTKYPWLSPHDVNSMLKAYAKPFPAEYGKAYGAGVLDMGGITPTVILKGLKNGETEYAVDYDKTDMSEYDAACVHIWKSLDSMIPVCKKHVYTRGE